MKSDKLSNELKDRLLIVEPDALLRWSLSTYLSRWFQVYPADSSLQADKILDQNTVDAAVIYDDSHEHFADQIEAHARKRNASMRIVRTVMNLPNSPTPAHHCQYIEKPFKLDRLAHLLGVDENRASSNSGGVDVR